jgi:hypothetical protein
MCLRFEHERSYLFDLVCAHVYACNLKVPTDPV